jgi:D-amino peptidase
VPRHCRTPTSPKRSPRSRSTLVTGDATTAEETRAFCPSALAAIVKESTSRFAANSLHPAAARELIAEQACLAIASCSAAAPVAITLPATLAIRFKTTDYAELASRIEGCEQTGATSAAIVGRDALSLFRTFVTVVLLCRGLRE